MSLTEVKLLSISKLNYVTTYIIALKKFDESLLLNVLEHFLTLVDFNHQWAISQTFRDELKKSMIEHFSVNHVQ